ncbi:unnamed protein product [[Candida] boidinii]|nr:unnamed protein product [[Candida] boidinii]
MSCGLEYSLLRISQFTALDVDVALDLPDSAAVCAGRGADFPFAWLDVMWLAGWLDGWMAVWMAGWLERRSWLRILGSQGRPRLPTSSQISRQPACPLCGAPLEQRLGESSLTGPSLREFILRDA